MYDYDRQQFSNAYLYRADLKLLRMSFEEMLCYGNRTDTYHETFCMDW